eukprot:GHVP01068956.1.p1 GENE.GHVP01068956.1~~GHVP01068956.1.p1  ORF type:complete len:111 (+),score=3.59 GHVP01068956.1:526-858(+)
MQFQNTKSQMWRCFITAGIMTYDFDAPRHWSDREYPYQSHLRCVRRPGDNIIPGRERTSRKYRVTTLTVELDEDDVSQQFFVMDVSEDILGLPFIKALRLDVSFQEMQAN